MLNFKIIDNTLIIINDEEVIVKELNNEQKRSLLEQVENFTTLKSLKKILNDEVKIFDKVDEKVFLKENTNVIKKGNDFYIKDFNIKIPDVFKPVILQKEKLNNSVINFLKLLETNPITAIKEKLPKYLVDNNLKLTENGYIVSCRQVWKVRDLITNDVRDKVISLYTKVKGIWKKSPKNIWLDDNFNIVKEIKGTINLQDAYNTVITLDSKTYYTSNYTKIERWTVGEMMEIGHRTYNNVELVCGSDMLHIRSNPKELSGYGDTNIIVLINPADVVSCVEEWKFGVAKCYFAAILDENDDFFKKPLSTFEFDFMKLEWDTIDKDLLEREIINFSNEVLDINLEDYKKIIEERKTTINEIYKS